MKTQIKLVGYDLIGQEGSEGIRYVWKDIECRPLLESASFINKTKGVKDNISGYTSSVSMGCILKHLGYACKFCRTGAVLPYSGMLSAYDIAKENLLMVLVDMERPYHIDLSTQKREFAYMGQGEPGYSYAQLRLAIKLTDYALKILGQKTYRHIISTVGIPEMICAVCDDIEKNYFNSKITLHFSLHLLNSREKLMPINTKYPYQDVLKYLEKYSVLTHEKVCIGILLFNEFISKNQSDKYTTTMDEIDVLLNAINKDHFRISLCEYNQSVDVGHCKEFSKEKALQIFEYIVSKGYEVKLFSSFGQKENAACGMLGGQKPQILLTKELKELEAYAEELIEKAASNII